ncbi:MAG: RNA methyltransferase, partial [Campylobacteraceae bacterium]|nr:RNA methyltransferase [Campylobacteraceae bacterium]
YPDGVSVDFGGESPKEYKASAFLVGCEGGFSQRERNLLEKNSRWELKSPFVLRSESALLTMSAKVFV